MGKVRDNNPLHHIDAANQLLAEARKVVDPGALDKSLTLAIVLAQDAQQLLAGVLAGTGHGDKRGIFLYFLRDVLLQEYSKRRLLRALKNL